jgi:hypothetical protein
MLNEHDIDYYGELRAEPEIAWPGELPEYVEEWNQLWFERTQATRDVNLRRKLPTAA